MMPLQHGEVQCNLPLAISHIQIRLALGEQLDNLQITLVGGLHQRGPAVLTVLLVYICSLHAHRHLLLKWATAPPALAAALADRCDRRFPSNTCGAAESNRPYARRPM